MRNDIKGIFEKVLFLKANKSLWKVIVKRFSHREVRHFDQYFFEFVLRENIADGKFLEAYNFLRLSLRYIDSQENKTKCCQMNRVWKYILADDFESALRVISTMVRKTKQGQYNDALAMFQYGILGGDFIKTSCARLNLYFDELLNKKRVAIVGPANDPEIDFNKISHGYDVIIILNYEQGTLGTYKKNPEVKVISYYNAEYFHLIFESTEKKHQIFSELDGIVLKGDTCKLSEEIRALRKTRDKLNFEQLLYYGNPNMIQNIVLDLLQFQPHCMDVYGCNLNLTNDQYRKDYIGNKNKYDKNKYKESFSIHNLIIQFQILEILYKNRFITPDNMLRDVLDMGIEQYLIRMEELFNN